MTIAYLINQYPKPSHSFISSEIRELESLGVEVERISLRGWEEVPVSQSDEEEQRRTTYVLQKGVGRVILSAAWLALFRPLRFAAALRSTFSLARASELSLTRHLVYLAEACWLVRRLGGNAQHLHAHFGTNTATIALLASKLDRIPFSFTVHGPEEFDKPTSLSLGQKIRAASLVVAITSFCRSQLYRWAAHEDWNKIHVVHCTPDRKFFEQPGSPAPRTNSLVCVGRLCEQKGQLLLLQAISDLRDNGLRVALVLAGDGPMRKQVEQTIDHLALHDQVRITGWIGAEQVRSELLAADALVLPSFAEGLPIVIMEAMALGRPVISTFVAGIPELVRSGEDGFLVAAGDVSGLGEAIKTLFGLSPEDFERLGASARARVSERHSPQAQAATLLSLFRATKQKQTGNSPLDVVDASPIGSAPI